MSNAPLLSVYDCKVENNVALSGGGIEVFVSRQSSPAAADIDITNRTVTGNSTLLAGGGGIAARLYGSTLPVADSIISRNESAGSGGGLYVISYTSTTTIDRVEVTGYTSASDGGGIWASTIAEQAATLQERYLTGGRRLISRR